MVTIKKALSAKEVKALEKSIKNRTATYKDIATLLIDQFGESHLRESYVWQELTSVYLYDLNLIDESSISDDPADNLEFRWYWKLDFSDIQNEVDLLLSVQTR